MGLSIEVGKISDFAEGTMTEVKAEGHHVLVIHQNGEFFITNARCPHLGGHLAHGKLEGTTIICPVHGSQFNIETGAVIKWTSFDGAILEVAEFVRHPRPLPTYAVTITDDGVLWMGAEK